MSTKKTFLSVIVPVYNEVERLSNLLVIDKFLKKQKFKTELIVVNDGSTDKTLQKLKSFFQKNKIFSYFPNKGKGFAIKTGMLAAKGQYRLFTDIDLSTPIDEFQKFGPYLNKYDVLIGSRKLNSSTVIVHQPLIREYLGKGFTQLSRIILQMDISDFTCGFKCFSKKAAEEIFSKQKINRWGFDSEILFLSKIKGLKIKEIPVKWLNDNRTRVKFPGDLIRSFYELLQIRYNYFKKLYE